jgi:hypothetical protein
MLSGERVELNRAHPTESRASPGPVDLLSMACPRSEAPAAAKERIAEVAIGSFAPCSIAVLCGALEVTPGQAGRNAVAELTTWCAIGGGGGLG